MLLTWEELALSYLSLIASGRPKRSTTIGASLKKKDLQRSHELLFFAEQWGCFFHRNPFLLLEGGRLV